MEFSTLNILVAAVFMTMLISGTLTNILTFFICMRKRLRSVPTFVFIAFMSIVDIIPLYGFSLDWMFYTSVFDSYLSNTFAFYCKIEYFLHFFPLKASAWLLVALSAERYFSVQIKIWRIKIFNSNKAVIVSAIIISTFFMSDFYLNFANEHVSYRQINSTNQYEYCDEDSSSFSIYSTINTYAYSIVPFVLLVIFNGLCIYTTYRSKKATGTSDQKLLVKRMTLLVAMKTSLFLLFTAPIAIANGYFGDDLRSAGLTIVLKYLNMWRFIHHTSSFFLLFLVNVKFRQEVILGVRNCTSKHKILPAVTASTTQSIKSKL